MVSESDTSEWPSVSITTRGLTPSQFGFCGVKALASLAPLEVSPDSHATPQGIGPLTPPPGVGDLPEFHAPHFEAPGDFQYPGFVETTVLFR